MTAKSKQIFKTTPTPRASLLRTARRTVEVARRRAASVGAAVALGGFLATPVLAAETGVAEAGVAEARVAEARVAEARVAEARVDVRSELECLALTIYFEARGEPDEGKLAVGHVVMNRAQHPLFPPGVCSVVRQGGDKLRYRCQFSWWCDGRSDRPRDRQAWTKSRALAGLVYWDYSRDPTAGALWYHSDYVRPKWRRDLTPGPKIGRHVFYGLTNTKVLSNDP